MSLGKKNIGESLSWKQVDLNQYYICKSNKWYMSETKDGNATAVYELQSYDITSNLDDTYDYIGEKQTVYQIKKGTYIVEKGGHTVHFVFKLIKVTKKPDNYYQFEDEDGNIINGIQNKSLGKKKVGDRLSWNHLDLKQYYVRKNTKWSMSDTYETSWKEVYKLIRYEITSNMSGECLYKSKVISVSKIINSTYKVCEGGITVHFIFQVIKSGGDPSGSPEITDSKEPQPSGEINPDIPTIPLPAAEQGEQEFDQEPAVCGRIEADKRNQEYFIVQEKIPTTESTYVEVKGKQYLLGYEFTKVVGTKTYNVPVTVQYTLEWNDIKQQTIMSQEVSVMDVVTVTRPYAYWVIDNIDYYTIDSAYVTNKVLPEGHVLIKADASANVIPTLQVKHTNAVMDHIQDPSNVNGVYIDGGIISGGVTKPMPPNKSFTAEVEAQVGNILARNDSVEFNGVCIMDDSFYPVEGKSLNHLDVINQRAEVCGEDVLFKQDNVIPSSLLNDRYASGGSVTYRRVTSINSKLTDTVTYLIPSINDVVVHTPVVCDVKVEADNQSYNQLIAPRGNCTSIVLDESRELNDMDIMISNTGTHSYYKGYSMRDFSHSIRDPIHASYIAQSKGEIRNEIMFPFDVYRVNEDGKESYIVKNTWIVIGRKKVKFFVPMWVDEGVYTVRCRSIAINATEDLLSNTEEYANVNPNNYVATNQFQVEISGRIYGLHIYDISEYPLWEKVFREDKSLELRLNHPDTYPLGTNSNQYDNKKSYSYTVGVNDSYGKKTNRKEKYTIPLVDGNHPIYENQGIFKSGYAVRFGIETTGNMFVDKTQIRIRPTFWYVDKNGKNRTEVDLYYTEEVTSDNQTQYSNSNDSSNQLSLSRVHHVNNPGLKEKQAVAQHSRSISKKEWFN